MARRIILSLFLLLSVSLFGNQSEEEQLFARRIIEFWKDKDYGVVKQQTLRFLNDYPNSAFRDSFLTMLGDSYWHEYDYSNALNAYSQIQTSALQDKTHINRLDCLYHLGDCKAHESE